MELEEIWRECMSYSDMPSSLAPAMHSQRFGRQNSLFFKCVWHFSNQGHGALGCTETLPVGTNPKTTWKTFHLPGSLQMGDMYRSLWQTCLLFLFVLISCHQWFPLLPFQQSGPTSVRASFSLKNLSEHVCVHSLLLPPSLQLMVYQLPDGLYLPKAEIFQGWKRKKRRRRLAKWHINLLSQLKQMVVPSRSQNSLDWNQKNTICVWLCL